jgi:hypothetical protein
MEPDAVFWCSKNEWAPVHESSAGPYIFVIGEGGSGKNQYSFRIRQRVASTLQSRGVFELLKAR